MFQFHVLWLAQERREQKNDSTKSTDDIGENSPWGDKAELWLYSINQILTSSGYKMSMYAVRQIKALNHLYCKRHKRFKRTTNSDHNRAIYENLLEQQFSMTRPNQAWSSDITYIWTVEGWLYLAAVKDLYTKQVVGYSLNERMTTQLVCNALNMAIHNQNQPKNWLCIQTEEVNIAAMNIEIYLSNMVFKVQWASAETVTIMHRLKAFGEYWKWVSASLQLSNQRRSQSRYYKIHWVIL